MQKDTVVRRIMEEENTKRNCTLCPRKYESGKALREHLKTSHKGHEALEQALKSVAPDACRYCHQEFKSIHNHERKCAARQRPEAPEQQAPSVNRAVQQHQQQQREQGQPHPYAGLSNAEILDKFKERLTNHLKLDPKGTVPDYLRDLKNFMQHELDLDKDFKARDWFLVGPRGGPLRPLQQQADYVEHLTSAGQGKKTVDRISTVYTHLHTWITEHLNDQLGDPMSVHLAKAERAKVDRGVARRSGAYEPGQGSKEKKDTVTNHLDVNIVWDIWKHALNHGLRQETMEKFSKGDFTHPGCKDEACDDCRCRLGIKSEVDAENFFALSLFLCNVGVRLECVINVKVGALQGASHALVVCPHCGAKASYQEHKRFCHM